MIPPWSPGTRWCRATEHARDFAGPCGVCGRPVSGGVGAAGHNGRMSTIVFLHAHPDDEASQTSGSMARAVDEGHRVVVVFATHGDHGESPDDLAPGESVVDRRRVEAAARFAAVLDEEDADIAVGYDWHGGYGHPDHVQVHRVLHRGAELAVRRPRVLESTMNRDAMRRFGEQARAAGASDDEAFDPDQPMDDGNPLGEPESAIHWQVDVGPWLDRRRAALEAHRSQTTDVGTMLSMPPEIFAVFFGREHYIEPGRQPGMVQGWPFGD